MVTLTDVIVLTGSGLVGGICTGLLIRSKQIKNLKDQIDAADNSYARLLELYMDRFYKQQNTPKKGPGRPKGSKNKPKTNGRSITRKYTRKSSK